MRPVLVIVTKDPCGPCSLYKQKHRDNVIDELKKQNNVDIVEINPQATDNINVIAPSYHNDLIRFMGWFPLFALFTGESWNNKDGSLSGEILGGKMVNGALQSVTENRPGHDVNGVVGWVNNALQNSVFSPRGISSGNSKNANSGGKPFIVNATSPTSHGDFPRFGRVPPRNPNITGGRNSRPGNSPSLPSASSTDPLTAPASSGSGGSKAFPEGTLSHSDYHGPIFPGSARSSPHPSKPSTASHPVHRGVSRTNIPHSGGTRRGLNLDSATQTSHHQAPHRQTLQQTPRQIPQDQTPNHQTPIQVPSHQNSAPGPGHYPQTFGGKIGNSSRGLSLDSPHIFTHKSAPYWPK